MTTNMSSNYVGKSLKHLFIYKNYEKYEKLGKKSCSYMFLLKKLRHFIEMWKMKHEKMFESLDIIRLIWIKLGRFI